MAEQGKFDIITKLTNKFTSQQQSTVSVGNNAAVIACNGKSKQVSTCLLLEGINFNLVYTPLKHLGFKAVTGAVSKIAAMNAQACQIIVSAGVSARFSEEDIETLFDGVYSACKYYNTDVAGIDITSSVTGMVISVTAIGEAKPEDVVYRKGAQDTDLICISGDTGSAYAGLQILERERLIFETNSQAKPQLEGYDYILQRQLQPHARIDMPAMFSEYGIKPTAMTDVTDGLASDLMHICKESDKGARIFLEKIPISAETNKACDEMNMSAITAALNGGDDYEMIFTLPLSQYEKIKGLAGFEVIGHITPADKGICMVTPEGQAIEMKGQGWK